VRESSRGSAVLMGNSAL